MKKRYDIKILGQELAVLSDAEDEQVANVVQFVNEKMEDIVQSSDGSADSGCGYPGSFKHFRRFFKIKGS